MPSVWPEPPGKNDTLILGVGNLLLQDEGVGIHVIQALERENLPAHVRLLDGGTGGFHLMSWLQEFSRIIMVDATLDGQAPGTIRLLHPRYAADFPPLLSAHEIGLRDLIEAMLLTDTLPTIELITVSVADAGTVGMELSPQVREAIPAVIRLIRSLI